MDGMPDTALLAAPSLLDRPAVVGGTRDWTWREAHAAALELAQQFEPHSHVCNLCTSRIAFLVTWLATLRRNCVQLLPPSGGHADLVTLLDEAGSSTVVVDDASLLETVKGARARNLVYRPEVPRAREARELAWTPNWDATCVCLYTSGSTGKPQPQFKNLRHLSLGARALGARLDGLVEGGLAAWRAIVCSVPQQHMFGFETSIMLALVQGLPVLERRPLLPSDVRAAHERVDGPTAWIATPLHLRALAQAGETLPDCRLALVSTMPLAPSLAADVEALVHAPVVEIFGSTETGVMATRRSACDSRWQPAGDVRLESDGKSTRAWSSHFPSPYVLSDRIALGADGRFELLGRDADMLKIGGRRASLAGLNLLLQDLPGLRDGVFYVPPTNAPTERLVLIHAGPLDRAFAEQWLRARIDPVFLPRAWLEVPRLPRDANGKLPRAAIDALHASSRKTGPNPLDFEIRVAPDHPALPGHFPGRPIVPGVLVLDLVFERLRATAGRAVAGVQRVKFLSPLSPEETARVQVELRESSASFRVSAVRDGVARPIAEGTALLAPVSTEAAA